MDTNILLESGTNELEILEFTLGDNHYLSLIHIMELMLRRSGKFYNISR